MRLNLLLSCWAVLTLAACSDDLAGDTGGGSFITFGVDDSEPSWRSPAVREVSRFNLGGGPDTVAVACRVDDGIAAPRTRAVPSATVDEFQAWAFFHQGTAVQPFFAAEPVTDRGAYWSTSQPYYWPSDPAAQLSFIALAGRPSEGLTVEARNDGFSFRYTVPASAAAQTDLMTAETAPMNGAADPGFRVPLTFRHLCAAVRFQTGSPLMPGAIERIILSGVRATGRYSGGAWSDLADSRSFSLGARIPLTGNEAGGADLYPMDQTFMFLPQTLGGDAKLEVVFSDNTSGVTRTLSASLAGHEWPMGKTTTYHIGITPDFKLEFTAEPPLQDAHYVMCNTAITVSGIAAGTGWTLTAAAADGADVTIQREADVNEYAKEGFWLDKRMNNGTPTNESVRGSASISGQGNVENLPVRVFIPENTGDNNRDVTLRLHVEGTPTSIDASQIIRQLSPAWVSSVSGGNNNTIGWEQIDDNNRGIYGFYYTAQHVYVYNNSHLATKANSIIDQVRSLITQYNAEKYVRVERYDVPKEHWYDLQSYRNYVWINYTELNSLEGKAQSVIKGLDNTRELFNLGGTALSGNFEKALKEMKRVDDASNKAYREKDEGKDPFEEPKWVNGTTINESQILVDVLKKNRYYLNTATVDNFTVTTPLIKAEDIVWYLPAYSQFGGAPAWNDGAVMSGGEYWSSTAAEGTNAYSGSGVSTSRTELKNIRVARNRP